MKLSIPNIKLGSAGIGFLLCLGMMISLGIFLHGNADKTLQARQNRIPTAEIILNEAAYASAEIEKDLPPIVDDTPTAPIETSPTETRTPLFEVEDEALVATENESVIAKDDIIEELEDLTKKVEEMEKSIENETKEDIVIIEEEEIVSEDITSTLPPRIALIISDMGLSESATQTAVDILPKGITLAFAPYANNVDEWVKKAKSKGHDILISVPMEPKTFPNDDPGPNALLTSLPDSENIKRLKWALSQARGYVGIVNFMGSRFTASQEKMSPIMQYLKGKNLMVLDSGSGNDSLIPSMSRINGITYATNDRFIDNKATSSAIDEQLKALETMAETRGQAIGIGFPYPITFDRIINWSQDLERKGILLVPISDLSSEKAKN